VGYRYRLALAMVCHPLPLANPGSIDDPTRMSKTVVYILIIIINQYANSQTVELYRAWKSMQSCNKLQQVYSDIQQRHNAYFCNFSTTETDATEIQLKKY